MQRFWCQSCNVSTGPHENSSITGAFNDLAVTDFLGNHSAPSQGTCLLRRNCTAHGTGGACVQWDYATCLIDAENYIGVLDTIFMFAYAVGLFVSGRIGDRFNLRYVSEPLAPVLACVAAPWALPASSRY